MLFLCIKYQSFETFTTFYILSWHHCFSFIMRSAWSSRWWRDFRSASVCKCSSPANYSVNYNKNEIRINFDEFVKLDNPRQQVIFSPPIEPRPTIMPMSMASKSFTIDMPVDSLQKETTYTINFGLSVQDNNEGNILPYFRCFLS